MTPETRIARRLTWSPQLSAEDFVEMSRYGAPSILRRPRFILMSTQWKRLSLHLWAAVDGWGTSFAGHVFGSGFDRWTHRMRFSPKKEFRSRFSPKKEFRSTSVTINEAKGFVVRMAVQYHLRGRVTGNVLEPWTAEQRVWWDQMTKTSRVMRDLAFKPQPDIMDS